MTSVELSYDRTSCSLNGYIVSYLFCDSLWFYWVRFSIQHFFKKTKNVDIFPVNILTSWQRDKRESAKMSAQDLQIDRTQVLQRMKVDGSNGTVVEMHSKNNFPLFNVLWERTRSKLSIDLRGHFQIQFSFSSCVWVSG